MSVIGSDEWRQEIRYAVITFGTITFGNKGESENLKTA